VIEGLFEHGFASATTDTAVITETWTKYKGADIGLALPRGVLVVDVDVAKGKRGYDDFVRLFGCAPEEMETAVATTPRGGWHVFSRFDPTLQLVQTTITPSVDVRIGGKGYVIAPSPGNGRRWIRPLLTTQLMEAPAWLIAQLKQRAEPEPTESTPYNGETSERAQETLRRACAALAVAPPGFRDATIGQVVYRVGRLAGAGELESGSALQALLAAMAANPGTDKSHRDKVERCFNDGFKNPAEPGPIDDRNATEDDFGVEDHAEDHRDSGAGDHHDDAGERASDQQQQQTSSAGGSQSASGGWDPIDLDMFLGGSDVPAPELGDDALPQGWADIIRAYAAVAEAPPDYAAIASIVGAAGAIGNAYVVEGKPGWREPAVLWGMLIGPPSAHKTPAMKAAHSALAAIDHELYLEFRKECDQIEVQHQLALDAAQAAKEPKKSVRKPEKPPLKHLLHDDTSLEKLTINMAASPHGAVAFYSELAGWFASFSRYSSSGDDSSGRALWNRAYDAERFKRDRVKNEGPPIVVPAAACSVVGAIQPDKLRQIWPKSHDGLLARPIYVWPRLAPLPSEGSNDDGGDDISGGETYAFRKAFKALYDLPLVVDDEGVPRPAVIRLANEARSPFHAAKRDCELRARRERGLIGEWLGKGPGRILRLALTFQLMTGSLGGGAPPTSVGLDALERAIRYFHYAEGMLRRTLAGLEPTRSAEDALAVAKQIVKLGWSHFHFSNNDVGREQGFRWFRGEDAESKRRRDNALNVLIDAKAIRQDLVQTGKGVIQKWAVNPDLGEKIRDL
jgi:putative DNA primase/helicase